MLAGNRFTIKVRDVTGADNLERSIEALNGVFPNYFGEQRFGSRKNNFDVGLAILKGDFEGAVMNFLTDISNETNQEAIEARTRLAGDHDFTEALDYFPTYLKYERTILDYLSKYERNFANAIRKLPRSINLMFVHSVEDMIFNRQLEKMIAEGHTSPVQGDLVCAPDADQILRPLRHLEVREWRQGRVHGRKHTWLRNRRTRRISRRRRWKGWD